MSESSEQSPYISNESEGECPTLVTHEETSNNTSIELKDDAIIALENVDVEGESVDFLLSMVRTAKKKIKSKKINNSGKVRWAKVGIESAKVLLYSGIISKLEKRRLYREEDGFLSIMNAVMQKDEKEPVTKRYDAYGS